MMRQLDPMKGHGSPRKNGDGTKTCKRCLVTHPVDEFVLPGVTHRESPYCPECRKVESSLNNERRKARRGAFPY